MLDNSSAKTDALYRDAKQPAALSPLLSRPAPSRLSSSIGYDAQVVRLFALVALVGCSFEPGRYSGRDDGGTTGDDGDPLPIDAPPDADTRELCDDEAGLHVCFSFDQSLQSPLANEGAAAGVELQLTSAAPIARPGGGQAVAVTPASKLYIPSAPSLTGIRTLEMWVRIDADPPTAGARIGLLDADVTPAAMSFFYYRQGTLGFQLRYEIAVQLFIDRVVTPGTWVYLAEVCDNGTLTAYIDAMAIGTGQGCNPGDATPHGIIVGANNNQNGNKDSELTGAIDGLRMWTVARTQAQISEAYGSFASQ